MKPTPPYRFPDTDVLRAGPWTVDLGGERRALPTLMPSWDYATVLELERELTVDLAQVTDQSSLHDGACLSVAVLWRSTASELRGSGAAVPVENADPILLSVRLPGRDLGGTLELETVLMLREGAAESPRVAFRAGSLLWSDRKRCRLQGDAPMFPIEISDFAALGLDSRTPWHLEIRDDLDSPAMGAMHLLVNRDVPTVVDAVSSADNPDDAQSRILSAMYADVGRTLAAFALSHAEFDTATSFDEETLGAALRGLLAGAFPGETMGAMRRRRDADVTRWASDSNAAFGLFSD